MWFHHVYSTVSPDPGEKKRQLGKVPRVNRLAPVKLLLAFGTGFW